MSSERGKSIDRKSCALTHNLVIIWQAIEFQSMKIQKDVVTFGDAMCIRESVGTSSWKKERLTVDKNR